MNKVCIVTYHLGCIRRESVMARMVNIPINPGQVSITHRMKIYTQKTESQHGTVTRLLLKCERKLS